MFLRWELVLYWSRIVTFADLPPVLFQITDNHTDWYPGDAAPTSNTAESSFAGDGYRLDGTRDKKQAGEAVTQMGIQQPTMPLRERDEPGVGRPPILLKKTTWVHDDSITEDLKVMLTLVFNNQVI